MTSAQRNKMPATQERPLEGRSIAITRPPEQAAALATQLAALGARVTALSAIAIEPPDDVAVLDAAIRELGSYDWLIFTSVNGVRAFDARLAALGLGWSARRRARIAAIGPATAAALTERGVPPDLVPEEYVAEALVEALGNVAGQRMLLPRADIARQALAEELTLRGAEVREIAAYRTVEQILAPEVLRRALVEDRVDAITFTSSSTVRGFIRSLRAAGLEPATVLQRVALAAIGPITATTLREYGLEPTLVAQEYTIPGLVSALVAHFALGEAPEGA